MVTQAEAETENELLERARSLIDPPMSGSGGGNGTHPAPTPTPVPIADTVVECIVIDRNGKWCSRVPVDLNGVPTASFEWGYYGNWYPVLVEGKADGILRPWYLPDKAGRDPGKLYIAEKQEGYRGAWKSINQLYRKVQIGLMVALAFGVLGLLFVFVKG